MLLTCKLWSSSEFKAMVCSRQCHPLGVVWTPVGVFLVFGTFEIYWLVVSVIKIESSTYLVLCAQLCSKRLIKMNYLIFTIALEGGCCHHPYFRDEVLLAASWSIIDGTALHSRGPSSVPQTLVCHTGCLCRTKNLFMLIRNTTIM